MSIVQSEGFELVGNGADLNARGWSYAEGSIAATASKWGSQAWDLGSLSANVLNYPFGPTVDNPYIGVSFWRKYENEPSAGTWLVIIGDAVPNTSVPSSSASHVGLLIQAAGALEVKRAAGIVVDTLPGVISGGVWQHYEFRVFIDHSAGTMELWIDGIKVVDETGIDTRDTGSQTTVVFNGNTGAVNSYIDDIVLSKALSAPVALTGVHRIHTLLADGNGTNTAWTGTSTDVDDPIGASDGDSTFAVSNTINAKQDYTFADLTESPATIFGVQVTTEARKTDAGVVGITPYVISNAVTDNGTEFGTTEAYGSKQDIYELNPDGAVAWTEATVNAVIAGHEITTV